MELLQQAIVPQVARLGHFPWMHDHSALPESNVPTLVGMRVPQSGAPASALPLLLLPLLPLLPLLAVPLLAPLLADVSPPASVVPVAAVSSPHPVAIAPTIAPTPETPTSHWEGRMMFEASLEARTIRCHACVTQ
jgi:hypothetical protein